ncbi:MAG: hypothetical protein ACRDLP_09225 [Solirubrobacteraceae bacterium]
MTGPARMVGVAVVAALVVAIPAFASSPTRNVAAASTSAPHVVCTLKRHHPRDHQRRIIRRCVVICEGRAHAAHPAARVRVACVCVEPATGATGVTALRIDCPKPPPPCTGATGTTGASGSTTPTICGPCPLASMNAGRLQPRIVVPGCPPCGPPIGATEPTASAMCVPICILPAGATGATGTTRVVIWCEPRIPLPCPPPPTSVAVPPGYACPMGAKPPAS